MSARNLSRKWRRRTRTRARLVRLRRNLCTCKHGGAKYRAVTFHCLSAFLVCILLIDGVAGRSRHYKLCVVQTDLYHFDPIVRAFRNGAFTQTRAEMFLRACSRALAHYAVRCNPGAGQTLYSSNRAGMLKLRYFRIFFIFLFVTTAFFPLRYR